MKRTFLGMFVVIAIVSSILLFGCPKQKEPEEIKIGAILPLTGPAAQFGEWKKQGLPSKTNMPLRFELDVVMEWLNNREETRGRVKEKKPEYEG